MTPVALPTEQLQPPNHTEYSASEFIPKTNFVPDNFNNIHRHSILYRSNQEMGKSKIKSPKQSTSIECENENNNNKLPAISDSSSKSVLEHNYDRNSTPNFSNQLKMFHRFGGSIQNLPRPMRMSTKKISASEFQLYDDYNSRHKRDTVHDVPCRTNWFSRWSSPNSKSSPVLSSSSLSKRKQNSGIKSRSSAFQWRNLFPVFFKPKSERNSKV